MFCLLLSVNQHFWAAIIFSWLLLGAEETEYTTADASQYVGKLRDRIFLEGKREFVSKEDDAYQNEGKRNGSAFHIYQRAQHDKHEYNTARA